MSRYIQRISNDLWVGQQAAWPHGYSIYVIQEGESDAVKVGVASHPARRLSELQTGNSKKLTVCAIYAGYRDACRRIERLVLAKFSPDSIRGEWLSTPLSFVVGELESYCVAEARDAA